MTRARRPSLRAAIDAMCKSCIHDPFAGNGAWREQVEACSSSNCPLHTVRPRSKAVRILGTSARKDAREQPDPSEDAETDVSALLGAAFPHNEAAGG